MILKNLNLIGFGKYENKTISLENGINIIYGENESGKTTIHNFIEGMFYGFLKPYVRSTIYQEEHKKYQPWHLQRYAGIIQFIYDNNLYRIEREFTKGKEETKVILENTGEDISSQIDNGSSGRVLQPGLHFFGFNNVTFSNTISIKQLSSKTDEKLSEEVRDKLINFTSALEDDISIEKSIKDLDAALKDIGTVKAHTSIFGRTNNMIIQYEDELRELHKVKLEYMDTLDRISQLKSLLKDYEEELSVLNNELLIAEYQDKKTIYNEAKKVSMAIEENELLINDLSKYKDLSDEDYIQALKLNENINIINSKISETNKLIEELKYEIKANEGKDQSYDNMDFDHILSDYQNYERLDEEKNRLLYVQDNSEIEFLKRDFESTKSVLSRTYLIPLVTIVILVAIYFLLNSTLTKILATVISFLIIFLFYKRQKNNKIKLRDLEAKLEDLISKSVSRKNKIQEIEANQLELLKRYNLDTKSDLKLLYDRTYHKKITYDEEVKSLISNKVKLKSLEDKLQSLNDERLVEDANINQIYKDNYSIDLDDFRQNIQKKSRYIELCKDTNNKKELLKRILGNYQMEELGLYLDKNIDLDVESVKTIDGIKEGQESIKSNISETLLALKGFEERLKILSPQVSKITSINEELIRLKSKLKELSKRKESIQLAKSTIESLSKDIHNQFTPEINRKVGHLIEKITDGKYSNVRINNKLDIGIIDNISKELINVNNLSGGTIDQLYFSLRFGVISSIAGENLPLILDDCFIQYDDIRLKNILNLIKDISKDRQIILFSCQNRERDFCKEMNINFNLITLS